MWAQSKKSRRAEVGKHPWRVRRSIGPSETSWGDENAAVNTSKNHPVFIPAACAASKGNQTILAWLASKGNQARMVWLPSGGPKPKPAKLTVRNRFRRKNKPVKWHDFHHPRNKLFGHFHGISLGFPGVDAPFEGLGVYVTILDVFDRQTGGCAFARSAAVENDGLVFGKLVDAGFQLAF